MNRKTLTALGVFVALAVVAIVALRQPEKGDRPSDHPHPFPTLNPVEITTLDVTKGGLTTTLKNERGIYSVIVPVTYPADAAGAKAAFEALGKMEVSDLVTQQPDKQGEFEVDAKTGIRLIAQQNGKIVANFIVGKNIGSGTMVRLEGSNDIWRASGISKFTYDKTSADWRDKTITTFTAADAEKLEVSSRDGAKIALKKTGGKQGNDDKWEVTQTSVKIPVLDNSVPNGIVSALANWKTNDFVNGATPADAGLAPPALTITVGLKGGKTVTALIGNKKGEDEFYAKKADAPQVFLVKKFNLDRLNKRPFDFRDKTLCDVAAADLTEISVATTVKDKSYTLVKSGSDWKATKPAKLEIDASKVTPIASAFKDWKATGFADDQSPKDNGLGKPMAVITGKTKGKGSAQACLVRVGDESKDKVNYFVTTSSGPDVFLAPKWAIDRILIKPDDLKKAAAAAASASGPPARVAKK